MPTLVMALTLVAMLKMADVDFPRWHLAFGVALMVGLALLSHLSRMQALGQGLLTFGGAWLYFVALDRTNNRLDRWLHWLILVMGMVALLGTRLYIDVRVYGVSL